MASLEDMTRVIGRLYEAAVEPEQWPATLKSLADLLKASAAVAAFQDDQGLFPIDYSVGIAPEAMRAFFDRHHSDARVLTGIRKAPLGAYTDAMMVPRDVLLRSEYIQTWGIPNGVVKCVQAFAFRQHDCSGFIGAARPLHGKDFEKSEVELLNFLLPHVERAMKIELRMQQARLTEISAVQSLEQLPHAVLLVDKRARVFFANSAARGLLDARDAIGVDRDGLRAISAETTATLRRMIAAAADVMGGRVSNPGPVVLRLERRPPSAPLSSIIAPLQARDGFPWIPGIRPEVLVVVSDPERRDHDLQNRIMAQHGLTRTESAVASLVAQGRGVKATARILEIAPSTVRTHLHRVFGKTRTARQAELAALLSHSNHT